MNNGQMGKWIRNWSQARAGRFLLTQLTHTAITLAVLAALLLGAARVGALNDVLTPLAAPAADTSFTSINYQGRLADSGGSPINNTNPGVGMTFALYDADTGGSPLWHETHANVPVAEGLFSVRLGSITALDTSHLTGDRWLGIQVGTDPEMTPREKLTAVPYAMMAGTVPDGSITSAKMKPTHAHVAALGQTTTTSGAYVPLDSMSASITVDVDSDLYIFFSASVNSETGATRLDYSAFVDGVEVSGGTMAKMAGVWTDIPVAAQWLQSVSAGTHTVEIRWRRAEGAGTGYTFRRGMTVIAFATD